MFESNEFMQCSFAAGLSYDGFPARKNKVYVSLDLEAGGSPTHRMPKDLPVRVKTPPSVRIRRESASSNLATHQVRREVRHHFLTFP